MSLRVWRRGFCWPDKSVLWLINLEATVCPCLNLLGTRCLPYVSQYNQANSINFQCGLGKHSDSTKINSTKSFRVDLVCYLSSLGPCNHSVLAEGFQSTQQLDAKIIPYSSCHWLGQYVHLWVFPFPQCIWHLLQSFQICTARSIASTRCSSVPSL